MQMLLHFIKPAKESSTFPYLALTESAFCAMLDPGWASESDYISFIQTSLGDIIFNGVCLTRINDTMWATLILREYAEFTVHLRTRQRPAVNLSLLLKRQIKSYDVCCNNMYISKYVYIVLYVPYVWIKSLLCLLIHEMLKAIWLRSWAIC